MPTFESIVQELPNYLSQLLQQKANSLKDLTEGKTKRQLGTDSDIPGIYLIYNQEKPVYWKISTSSSTCWKGSSSP